MLWPVTGDYTIKARTTLTEPGLSVTRIAGRPRTLGNVGLALSGGGSRAASASLGVVRALHRFDLLRHVRAISSVSGGSWFSVPFTFLPERFDEQEFLGPWVDDPGDLRWFGDEPTSLRELSAGNFGVPLTKLGMSIPAIVGDALRDRFSGAPQERLWTRQVGEQLLAPIDLARFDDDHHPADFFAADERMADTIRLSNPHLDHPCYLVRQSKAMPRPYLIVNGAMRVTASDGRDALAPVQFTPWFSGVMGRFGTLDRLAVGGGGISSFGFGGQWQVGERERPVLRQRNPLALSDITGISSACYADAAGDIGMPHLCPTLDYFSPLWERPAAVRARFADAGSLENTGIANLLAYEDIDSVIAMVSSARPLQHLAGRVVVDRQVAALFGFREFDLLHGWRRYSEPGGGTRDFRNNQVFASSDGEFEALVARMEALHDAGEPIVVEQEHELVRNEVFAIAGGRKVRVLWVLLSPAKRWAEQLDPLVRLELGLRFPNLSTVRTQLREGDVALLAHFTSWMLAQNQGALRSLFA
jgi:hypothetical protein